MINNLDEMCCRAFIMTVNLRLDCHRIKPVNLKSECLNITTFTGRYSFFKVPICSKYQPCWKEKEINA